ncbi:MAG: hypothetical protein HY730_00255 [Candidatus Tectomicrobia bacterium]|uniref:Uncharacterized protein n=1 Tax=Tectimicrobiota bacterium TaxID=2528274 RepID=A0A933GJN5_UNCTE|nr:hypothetical protein [Candidatus Tectomicrobia bacterium]
MRETLDKTVVDKEHVYKAGQLISDGTTIDEKRAFQMALKGNQVMLRPLTNQFLNDQEREAEFAALSTTLARGTADFMTERGVSADIFGVSGHASLGFRLLGSGVGGKTEAGWRITDERNFNIMTQHYDATIRRSYKEAKDKGLNTQEIRQHVSETLRDYTNKIYKDIQNANKWYTGATAPASGVVKAFKEHGQIAANNPNIPLGKNP